jgi:hypothetical protein
MQWSAIFNKHKNNSEDCEEKQGKKSARRNQSDPHVCHLCGGILARGTNSYKEHHWNQRHQDEKNTKFCGDNADNLEDCDARSQFSQNSPTPSVDTQPTASGAQKIIQTTANSFFKACESEKTGQSSLDTIENSCETG